MLDEARCHAAFEARDRSADGSFIVGVVTTGIYCRPSCPARRPKPENVRFYMDSAGARMDGLRPCLRCRPDEADAVEAGVARAIALIESSDAVPGLAELAAAAGLAPHYFHRCFREATGITPAAYARARRADRARQRLSAENSVTDAIYSAGYSASSRFYAETNRRLGMEPTAWRNGGAGVVIRYAIARTSLGPMMVAATEKGICRLSFDEDAASLQAHFPKAELKLGDRAFQSLVDQAVALVEEPSRPSTLPLDVRGTAFQEAVWQALSQIPPGETRSYAQLAATAGNPKAVRAAGSACGANPVMILIPCHRAKRADGSLGGYAYGLERKKALLARETRD